MNRKLPIVDLPLWTELAAGDPARSPGYDAWLERALAESLADVEAGRFVTLDEAKREFGVE